MDSIEPGGIYREVGGNMEVTDECSNTGDIMGIEIRGGRALLCCNVGMGLSTKREALELDTSGFSPTTEDDRFILGKNSDECFLKRTRQLWSHNLSMPIRL